MDLPLEIIEKILSYADYKTLRSAMQVNGVWRTAVLNQAKHRCLAEIPKSELEEYTNKLYGRCETPKHWAEIFDNWHSWKNLDTEVDITVEKFSFNKDRWVATVGVCADYIAVGYADDDVDIYHQNRLMTNILVDDDIHRIHFISDEALHDKPSCAAVICSESIVLIDLQQNCDTISWKVGYCQKTLSTFKSRISFINSDNRLIVLRISRNLGKRCLMCSTEIDQDLNIDNTFDDIMATSLSERTCCVIIDNRFVKINLNNNETVQISLRCNADRVSRAFTWIFNDTFLISSYHCELYDQDILQTNLLSDKGATHTSISDIENTLGTLIYTIVLHASTLAVGCADGSMLFYPIIYWENVNISHYYHRVWLPDGFGSINAIDAVGKGLQRVYYVSGEFGVCKFICSTKNIF